MFNPSNHWLAPEWSLNGHKPISSRSGPYLTYPCKWQILLSTKKIQKGILTLTHLVNAALVSVVMIETMIFGCNYQGLPLMRESLLFQSSRLLEAGHTKETKEEPWACKVHLHLSAFQRGVRSTALLFQRVPHKSTSNIISVLRARQCGNFFHTLSLLLF